MVWTYYLHNHLDLLMMENSKYEYISYIPGITGFLFNIAFAILVYKDFKLNNIKSPLTVFITLLFGFIGIALFFIQVIYNQYVKKASTQHRI
jgi:hypothetical protein